MIWDLSWDQNNIINGKHYSEYLFALVSGSTLATPPPLSTSAPTNPKTNALTNQRTIPPPTTQIPPILTTTKPQGQQARSVVVFSSTHKYIQTWYSFCFSFHHEVLLRTSKMLKIETKAIAKNFQIFWSLQVRTCVYALSIRLLPGGFLAGI